MKKLLFILSFLVLVACGNKQENAEEESLETHLYDIFRNAQYGDTHAISSWAGRTWEFFGSFGENEFEAQTLHMSSFGFDSLCQIICTEFGQPTYSKLDFVEELIPKPDTGTFWMAGNEYRCYAMAEYTFIELLLPFDCTDDELMQYNFHESYKAQYGDYPMFD